MTDQVDDFSVANSCQLFRRIPLQPSHIVWDNNHHHRWIASSAAFRNAPGSSALSIDLEDTLLQLGLPIDHVVRDRSRYALAAVTAEVVRQLHQHVQRVPEFDNPTHGHVSGEKSKIVQRQLSSAARWIVFPEDWSR